MIWLLACTSTPPADSSASACPGDEETGAQRTIAPYVQDLTSTSAWVLWETDAGSGSRVDLDGVHCGEEVPAVPGADPTIADGRVHAVRLDGLEPGTVYEASARTGDLDAGTVRFKTPSQDAEIVRIVAMSDMQRDDGRPEQFRQVVHEGLLPLVRDRYDPELHQALDLALFPGDLVDNGWKAEEWREDFFDPGAELFAEVPLYPVPGNHEAGAPMFFRYFQLPEDGLEEHTWSTQRGRVRILGLDSNGWSEEPQLAWLSEQLAAACEDPEVDWLFAQLHHPHLSELWTPGEDDFSTQVVRRLEGFSEDCGKPSVHFFGHTHGYSRGESQEHRHLMVNVASAGGRLDRWGSEDNADYPEFAVSQDHYGFVLVEIDDQALRLERISLGTPEEPLDAVTTDAVEVLLDASAPERPTVAELSCSGLRSSNDLADLHGSHWQLAPTCDFEDLLLDSWRQDRNEFGGEDLNAGIDLGHHDLPEGATGALCARVRTRNASLVWSEWSEAVESPLSCD